MPLLALALLLAVPDAGPPPDPLAAPRARFDHRLDRSALDAAITQLDDLAGPAAAVLGARAHRFRAEAFELRQRPLHRAQGLQDLQVARSLALAAWAALQPGTSEGVEARLAAAKPEAVPALVELARADLELAGSRPPLEGVTFLKEARAVSARAVALEPDFDGGAPRRVHAATLSALPAAAGGDLQEARFEFERAIAAAPERLANRVEMAARYAVKAQDRSLFRALLEAALHLDPGAVPGERPEQLLARARAIGLLHREPELFRN